MTQDNNEQDLPAGEPDGHNYDNDLVQLSPIGQAEYWEKKYHDKCQWAVHATNQLDTQARTIEDYKAQHGAQDEVITANNKVIESLHGLYDGVIAERLVLSDAIFNLIESRLNAYLHNALNDFGDSIEFQQAIDEVIEDKLEEKLTDRVVDEVEDQLGNLRVEISTR